MIKLMVVGFSPIGTNASLGNRRRVGEKTVSCTFREVKCLQGYPRIGGWMLKLARLIGV